MFLRESVCRCLLTAHHLSLRGLELLVGFPKDCKEKDLTDTGWAGKDIKNGVCLGFGFDFGFRCGGGDNRLGNVD